jgi:menaquinone reductase, multiheme cytochrome c subunit
MSETALKPRFTFPRGTNILLFLAILFLLGGAPYAVALVTIGFSPSATDVGYAPDQPVNYSHALHVGQLGMDCRYCHTTVDDAAFAAIPPTQTCMNCHTGIKVVKNNEQSQKLNPVFESWNTGKPIEWVKIHDLPDYSYFNHSAHVNKGVGCVSCHGRIDRMETVYQAKPLNMAWCLDCHRQPEKYLRPQDQVTNMNYSPLEDMEVKSKGVTDEKEAQKIVGLRMKSKMDIKDSHFMTSCSTCHR